MDKEWEASVLIVDDDPLTVEILTEYLGGQGYRLTTAQSGMEAWSLLEQSPEKFDVIILDRRMPGMDGIEVLRRVKKHPQLKALPVIMQTAAMARDDIVSGLEAGAYYYLTKPFDEEMLCPIVRTAVEDRFRYLSLQEQQRQSVRVLGLMTAGSFRFQTLGEAHNLAVFLSNACPEPDRVVMGLSELLINAVEHGNLGIDYDEKGRLVAQELWASEIQRRLGLPENQSKYVKVFFDHEPEEIRIRIQDEGKGFDWTSYLEIDAKRAFDNHGRGIAMARQLSFDRLEYQGIGNEVVISIEA